MFNRVKFVNVQTTNLTFVGKLWDIIVNRHNIVSFQVVNDTKYNIICRLATQNSPNFVGHDIFLEPTLITKMRVLWATLLTDPC